jgi:hypothetical protein
MTQHPQGDATDPSTDIGAWAAAYAEHHWKIIPLRGKLPAIPNPHDKGSAEYQTCKGECGMQGHGVLDATSDLDTVTAWWSGKYKGANIGGRVPDSMFVLDVDVRSGGIEALNELTARHGKLPDTLTTITGTAGLHLFYRHPCGPISAARLPKGVELKTPKGYVVMPPSINPATGKRYTAIERPVAAPPCWLIALIRKDIPRATQGWQATPTVRAGGPSIADDFCASVSWADILAPHGWRLLDADADADGARWLHPTATSSCSATIRHGLLFVYSPNTQFDVTEASQPKGYTKFRAYAVLVHGDDMKAAARALKGGAG